MSFFSDQNDGANSDGVVAYNGVASEVSRPPTPPLCMPALFCFKVLTHLKTLTLVNHIIMLVFNATDLTGFTIKYIKNRGLFIDFTLSHFC